LGAQITHGWIAVGSQITVYSKKGVFRVEESDSNLYASIDKAADTLSRKLRKTKEKRNDKKGHASGADLAEDGVDDVFNKTAELPAEVLFLLHIHIRMLHLRRTDSLE
jgi:putative sigma-54 modulation protein